MEKGKIEFSDPMYRPSPLGDYSRIFSVAEYRKALIKKQQELIDLNPDLDDHSLNGQILGIRIALEILESVVDK